MCIHINTRAYIHTYKQTHTYIYICIYIYIYIYIYTCMWVSSEIFWRLGMSHCNVKSFTGLSFILQDYNLSHRIIFATLYLGVVWELLKIIYVALYLFLVSVSVSGVITCTGVCVQISTRTYMCMCMCMCMCVCVSQYACVEVYYMHTLKHATQKSRHTCIHVCMHMSWQSGTYTLILMTKWHIYIDTCMHVCMHAYIYTFLLESESHVHTRV